MMTKATLVRVYITHKGNYRSLILDLRAYPNVKAPYFEQSESSLRAPAIEILKIMTENLVSMENIISLKEDVYNSNPTDIRSFTGHGEDLAFGIHFFYY